MTDLTCPTCGHSWSAAAGDRCERCGTASTASPQAIFPTLPEYAPTLRNPTPTPSLQKSRDTSLRESAPAAWMPGDFILDRYEVVSVLGRGGMGEVLKVHHREWGIDLAVKTPRPELLESESGLDAFVQEAETWSDIGVHPHVVTCYYVRVIAGIPRIFAEFVDGGTLSEWIRSKRLYSGDALARILDIAIQVAWGLQRAHDVGVIHQDMKPGNVMMTPDGVAKVTDFGLSRAGSRISVKLDGSELETALVSVGGMTPAYASPEQWNRQPLSRRSDLWSWAVGLLEMFLGGTRWLKGFEAPASLSASDPVVPIPADVAKLLRACFSVDPEKRPATMRDAADVLASISGTTRREPRSGRAQADTLNNRALSMRDLGRHAEAERFFEQALAADPQHLQASYNRGLLRWRDGRLTDEALLARLRETSQKRDEIERLAGLIHHERGDVRQVREIKSHRGAAPGVAIANGVIATAGRDRVVRIGDRPLEGHADAINAVALGDRFAVSGGMDKTVRVWSLATHSIRHVLTAHAAAVASVAVAGKRALSGSWDGTLRLWDLESGKCLAVWDDHVGGVNAVAMTPDGLLGISGGSDKVVRIWNLEQRRCISTLPGHAGAVLAVAVSPQGTIAISGGTDQTVRAWNLATSQCIRIGEGHGDRVTSVAMGGSLAASAGKDRTVRLWDLESGRCRRTIAEPALAVALEGSTLVTAGDTVRVWEVVAGTRAPFVVVRPRRSEEVSADEERVSSALGKVRTAVTRRNWRQAVPLLATARGVTGFERQPEALELWAEVSRSTGRGTLRDAWQRASLTAHVAPVDAVALSDDGALAVSAGSDKVVRAWNVVTGKCLASIEHGGAVTDVATDGRIVISASLDTTVRVSDAGGAVLSMLKGHNGAVVKVDLSYGGRIAATLGMDRAVKLWETATGACMATMEATAKCFALTRDGKRAVMGAMALSGDGTLAATGEESGRVRLWKAATGGVVRAMERHTRAVNDVAMSMDGTLVVSGSEDGTVILWGVDGRALRVLEGHAGGVTGVALSPDARTIVSSGRDRTVRLWHLDWNIVPIEAAHWHEGARPLLETALQCGWPIEVLMSWLRWSGYGWVREEGVRLKLKELERR